MTANIDQARAVLRWRARRGMLENDLIITAFLDENETKLSDAEVMALHHLFKIDDNELLDILLSRSEPSGEFDTPEIHALVRQLRAQNTTSI
ncbi:succinate dehydrogenase assembly factor 2 [Brackiella oedipodis]|uniref:FAD assembly factor SdhE n=1 Tax=Brackiella oedipodis TaxID=124225 RepID=UPI00048CC44F|nr:succinate dehydrogenase assembly factor 2 [Brackiella oedipodis]